MKRKFLFKKFEEGKLKKRIMFMYGGELFHLKFIYKGQAIEAVIDRFPTAKIVNHKEDSYLIEAEVYGKGCLMWLLSQGDSVIVLEPDKFRKKMIETIKKMRELYINVR